MDAENVNISQLENGLTVASEAMDSLRSACVGVWVCAGSRHEEPGQEGMAHFWEHMAFKGTATRSALDIAKSLDRLGGMSNAFTSRESTCYFARVAESGLEEAIDILADIVLNPALAPEEIEREKSVVLQEIAMVEETPDDFAQELLWQNIWQDGRAAHPILGQAREVARFEADPLLAWRRGNYGASRIIVSAAGAVGHEQLVAAVRPLFNGLERGEPRRELPPAGYRRSVLAVERDVEQAHLLLSYPGCGASDDRRFALACLNTALGGQMSSRLFQEIREKRGLAYTVYSGLQSLSDEGALLVYAAAHPDRTGQVIELLTAEIRRMVDEPPGSEELEHVREHLLGMLFLTAESTEERMIRLAKNQTLFGRHIPLDETAERIRAVTPDQVAEVAADVLDSASAGLCVLAPGVDPDWAALVGGEFEAAPRPLETA